MNVKIIPSTTGSITETNATIKGKVNNPVTAGSATYAGADTETASTYVNQERRTISVNVLRTPNPLTIVDNETLVRYDGSEAVSFNIKQYQIKQVAPLDPDNIAEYVLAKDDIELSPRICIPKGRAITSVSLKYCPTRGVPVSTLQQGDPYLEFIFNETEVLYLPLADFIEIVSPGYALTSERKVVSGKAKIVLNVDYNKIAQDLNADYYKKSEIESLVQALQASIELEHDALEVEVSTREQEIARVEGLISAEETRAKAAEAQLGADLEEAIEKAEDDDALLNSKIDAEIRTRAGAIAEVKNLITEEASARDADVARLQQEIDEAATSADLTELEAALAQEVQNRQTADNSILSQVYTKTQADELLGGKQNKIDGAHKLSSDLVDDSNSAHKFITESKLNDLAQNKLDIADLKGRTGTLESTVANIEEVIPSQASAANQLADKDFVNSSIQTATATFRGNFATKAELDAYTGPADLNDYAIVNEDETHNGEAWRYKFVEESQSWIAEYKLNNTAFTEAQLKALNSGITFAKRNDYDVHLLNKQNPHEVTKSQIGLGDVVNAGLDTEPTEDSGNYITSGGVYTYVSDIFGSDGLFDIRLRTNEEQTKIIFEIYNKKTGQLIGRAELDALPGKTDIESITYDEVTGILTLLYRDQTHTDVQIGTKLNDADEETKDVEVSLLTMNQFIFAPQEGIDSLHLIIPETFTRGHTCEVVFLTGATNPTFEVTNETEQDYKLIKFGLEYSAYNPSANATCTLLCFNDGLNVNIVIAEFLRKDN